MDMYEFFYGELKSLKARTGLLQWEKLNEQTNPTKEIDDLISFMIDECSKPPFNKIKIEIKQRIVSRAVIEDKEFIGMNAKFVRRALNAWWETNGDRVLMAINNSENAYQKVVLTKEQNEKVDEMLESYRRSLESSTIQPVPKLEKREIEKEGAEWKSEIERKSTGYTTKGLTKEQYIMRTRLHRAASDFYKQKQSFKLKSFTIEGFEIFAESFEDAQTIYSTATTD